MSSKSTWSNLKYNKKQTTRLKKFLDFIEPQVDGKDSVVDDLYNFLTGKYNAQRVRLATLLQKSRVPRRHWLPRDVMDGYRVVITYTLHQDIDGSYWASRTVQKRDDSVEPDIFNGAHWDTFFEEKQFSRRKDAKEQAKDWYWAYEDGETDYTSHFGKDK